MQRMAFNQAFEACTNFEMPDLRDLQQIGGGSARESNPPTPLLTRHNGFEDRKGHRAPSTPQIRS